MPLRQRKRQRISGIIQSAAVPYPIGWGKGHDDIDDVVEARKQIEIEIRRRRGGEETVASGANI